MLLKIELRVKQIQVGLSNCSETIELLSRNLYTKYVSFNIKNVESKLEELNNLKLYCLDK